MRYRWSSREIIPQMASKENLRQSPFRAPSLCRHVRRELLRNPWLAFTPIISATACHQRHYLETDSRYKWIVEYNSRTGTLCRRGHARPSCDSRPRGYDVGPAGPATTGRAISQASIHLRDATPDDHQASGGTRGYAAVAWTGAGARWPAAWPCPSRGARRKRRLSRSRRARPNIWRFNILRRLMCPSTGLMLQGKVTPALTAS